MSRASQFKFGGYAVAVAGLILVFAGPITIGFIVMIVGFLIAMWSRAVP
jgi:hypothetical protein